MHRLQNAGRDQGKTTGGLTIPATAQNRQTYVGRFAPSPTGPLHSGSLVAALASYLDARSNQGLWYVRMEDLDPPRESPEAASQILTALEQLHLNWDGEVLYQSSRHAAYREALHNLQKQQKLFPCTCSRRELQEEHEGVYPGTCRNSSLPDVITDTADYALRCRIVDIDICFDDLLQGPQRQNLQQEVGDFILQRKDGLFAYQLAVVVDDGFQDVSHIIRGTDLLDSTPRQIYLQGLLGLPQPVYGHIPVIVNRQGQKLSKQHHAAPLDTNRPSRLLYRALHYLRQDPPPELAAASAEEVLDWAIDHWQVQRLYKLSRVDEDHGI